MILSSGPDLQLGEVLPVSTAAPESARQPHEPAPAAAETLEDVERNHIVAMLKRTRWRVDGPTGAARLLKMHPSTLRSRMQKLGIRRSADEAS
jgi:transcriptional regulator with GAF, ATPase, and Fis domain